MRRIIVTTFVSLDGVMQAPGGPEEDPTGGFDQGGWAVPFFDEDALEPAEEPPPHELLLGRGTYEIFAAHWPYDQGPVAAHHNRTRKHVASTTITTPTWENTTVITGDVPAYVRALRCDDGLDVEVHGSPGLLQTLLRHDLVDEWRLWIFPVLLGRGKRLFGDGTVPAALTLMSSRTTGRGITINTYTPAGPIEIGTTEFDSPSEAELRQRARLAQPVAD